jgi:fatty-acyl-CoA synthase
MSSRPVSLSYVCGSAQEPLRYITIGQLLEESASRWVDREALVALHQGIRWTYRSLCELAEWAAAGLLALGLEPGERVGIWAPNCAEWILAQFATAKAGLILVNINPAYRTAELEYALGRAGCSALIMAARHRSSDYIGMLEALIPGLADEEPGSPLSERLPSGLLAPKPRGPADPG